MERTEQFDFAFIDADKTEYIDYFEETLPRTAPERRDPARQHPARREPCSTRATRESARVTAELNDRLANRRSGGRGAARLRRRHHHGPQAVSGLPTDDRGWFELVLSNQPPLWKLMAEACGGGVWTDGDLQAALVPASPNRSFFNSVFYGDTDAHARDPAAARRGLRRGGGQRLDGVGARPTDERAREGLEAAGHKLDATPRAMGFELSEPADARSGSRARDPRGDGHGAAPPDQRDGLRLSARATSRRSRRCPAPRPTWRASTGRPSARPSSGPPARTRRSPSSPTLPEARGRGISGRLLGYALERQRERGKSASTLIATKLGFPVYETLGYRDVGGLEMWEKRKCVTFRPQLQRRADRRCDRGALRPGRLPRSRAAGRPGGAQAAEDPRRGARRRRLVRGVA